jgi:hypothetical protein
MSKPMTEEAKAAKAAQLKKAREAKKLKSEGLGDTIEKVTKKTGIKKLVQWFEEKTGKDCGCEERRELLNKLIRYRRTINCMTLAQYDRWAKERNVILAAFQAQSSIGLESLKTIYEIHRSLYGLPLELPCPTCRGSIKTYQTMTDQLEKTWHSYTNDKKK